MIPSVLMTLSVAVQITVTPDTIRPMLTKLPAKHRILSDMRWSGSSVTRHPLGKWIATQIRRDADGMLHLPPAKKVMTGRRLLSCSRRVLFRITTLTMAYHLTGKKVYADRAVQEMTSAAKFSDWNPSHFLDVGEMALALAIGVDMLADAVPAEARNQILDALMEKALKPGWDTSGRLWWATGNNNWTQVCQAGLLAAALVTADRDPEMAARTIARAITSQEKVMRTSYSPNGVYPEGPGYWYYGTEFETVLIALLEHAFGTDFNLHKIPGWDKTGDFMLAAFGPSGAAYNFCDGNDRMTLSPAYFYLAKRFNRPDYLSDLLIRKLEKKVARPPKKPGVSGDRLLPLALLWLMPMPEKTPEPPLFYWSGPKAAMPIAILRTSWKPDALYLGIKGGRPSSNHGHMDSGSFIFESDGIRWVLDPGAENYHKIESLKMNLWNPRQDSDRWKVFRLGTEAHALLQINDMPQNVRATGILTIRERPGRLPVVHVDLTNIYKPAAKSIKRTADLQENGLSITDSVRGAAPGTPVQFQFLTQAQAEILSPETLRLTRRGKSLHIIAPQGAVWQITGEKQLLQSFDTPFKPPVRQLAFTLPADQNGNIEWTVRFQPPEKK